MKKLFSSLVGLLQKGKKVKEEYIPYQGRWVDINGDTTLDFSGSILTVTHFGRKEQYPIVITSNEYETVIDSQEGGFELMSSLRDNGSGKLIGYDMVLDARGHTYNFVREQQKAQELEIKNLSKEAPKVITSDRVSEFSLSFEKGRNRSYDLDERWPDACYRLSLELLDDGKYEMSYYETFDSYMGANSKQIVNNQVGLDLAKLIAEHNLAQYNGYYFKNNSSAAGYSLYVTYQSKEELSICAAGDAADTCVFPLEPILIFFKKTLNL